MKSWKGIVLFLFLNFVVSVCATFSVLIYWERTRGSLQEELLPSLGLSFNPDKSTTPSPVAPTSDSPQPTPTETMLTYQVQAGDEFSSIAARFGISVDELISINGFTKDQPLGVGEVLLIPAKPTPLPPGVIEIKNVIGVGDLETERVLVKFNGEGELSLVGWSISDQDGNTFLFPQTSQLRLYKDGAIYIFTKSGTNNVIEMFWGLQQPVWQTGDVVSLRDTAGVERASYQIP
jgi:LysM repeat protein